MVNHWRKNNMSEGKKNDSGKAPIHFLTREFIEGVAQAQAFGAKKYGDYNFCNGLAYTRLLDAAMRHLIAFTWGEDNDNESGESHLSHAAANINMLMYTIKHHPDKDDRYKEQKLTVFTTPEDIDFMVRHKDKFIATMGEDLYNDSLNKLYEYKNKHTGSSFDDFLKELESSYKEASTTVEGTLDKEEFLKFSTDCVCGEINARHCQVHQEDKE
jgi:hypothetical protein